MRVLKRFFLIVLVSIIVMSCNSIKQEDEFSNLIQVQNVTNINQDLELRLDPYEPSDLRNGV